MTQESPHHGEQGRDRTGNDDGPGWSAAALTVLAIVAVRRAGEGCSGYDVKNVAERHLRSFFALSYGQIYPHLSRLEEEGLVERLPDTDVATGRRGRKVYRATAAGEARLLTWLRTEPETPWYRDEDLAKVLLVGHLDPTLTLARIQQRRERLESELRGIRDAPNDGSFGVGADPVRRLLVDIVVDRGVSSHSAQIDWCHRAERGLRRIITGGVR